MKKITLIFSLFIALLSNAQQERTVTATGDATIERKIKDYKVKPTLNMDQVFYSDPPCKTKEELKDTYFKILKDKGFDPALFKENTIEFLTLGYQKEWTVLMFQTTSKEMAEK